MSINEDDPVLIQAGDILIGELGIVGSAEKLAIVRRALRLLARDVERETRGKAADAATDLVERIRAMEVRL